jgi:hypothetical protein
VKPSLIQKSIEDISEERRRLILQLIGDDTRNFPLVYPLERLMKREEIYRWLIRNRITGKKFYDFCHEKAFSWNRVAKAVLSKIEKEKVTTLYVGKDVR